MDKSFLIISHGKIHKGNSQDIPFVDLMGGQGTT